MLRRLRKLLTDPTLPEQDEVRLGRLVNVLSLALALAICLPIVHNALAGNRAAAWVLGCGQAEILIVFWLNRRGKLIWAIPVLCYTLLAGTTALLCVSGEGIHDLAIMIYPATLVVAGMLLDTRRFVVFAIVAMLCLISVMVAGMSGTLVT